MAKHVVIVGAGFVGINVAQSLANTKYRITIIDKANHHLFQPLLYQVATAALSPGDIAVPVRAIFSKQKNVTVILGEVIEIDKAANTLFLGDGEQFSYDYLVLGTGAQYNYFGNNAWKTHAPGLKSLKDALTIRERILRSLEEAEKIIDVQKRKPYLTFVVIGGGPTGVEMAGSIAEIAKRNMMRDYRNFNRNETTVYLVEAAGSVLNGFPESLSQNALDTLSTMGVQVLLNSPVQEISAQGVQLKNHFIETPNVMWAAGVSATGLMAKLGVEQDRSGRVKVNPDLSIPGNSNVFVAGDAAYLEDENGKPLPGLAPVAMQQGRFIGSLLKKQPQPNSRPTFTYVDKGSMATIGRAKAVADIKGLKLTGFVAWLMWGVIHIFFLIGFRNRIRVFAEWLWFYLSFKRGVRLITKNRDSD